MGSPKSRGNFVYPKEGVGIQSMDMKDKVGSPIGFGAQSSPCLAIIQEILFEIKMYLTPPAFFRKMQWADVPMDEGFSRGETSPVGSKRRSQEILRLK